MTSPESTEAESVAASRARPEALVEGRDDMGRCFYLAGRPVRCREELELRLPGERWTRVRFEFELQRPTLLLYVGHRFEHRFEVRQVADGVPKSERQPGDYIIYDRQEEAIVVTSDRWPFDEGGATQPRWPELERDRFLEREEAERTAGLLNDIYARCETVRLPEIDRCELRWSPDSSSVTPPLGKKTSAIRGAKQAKAPASQVDG